MSARDLTCVLSLVLLIPAPNVFAGSDDGYLYCLEARTGRVVWQVRGAPPDRPDRRHLGSEHLVSFWPATRTR